MTFDRDLIDRQARIRDRAYAIWEREGRPNREHLECLQLAERLIEAEEHAAASGDPRRRRGVPSDHLAGR